LRKHILLRRSIRTGTADIDTFERYSGIRLCNLAVREQVGTPIVSVSLAIVKVYIIAPVVLASTPNPGAECARNNPGITTGFPKDHPSVSRRSESKTSRILAVLYVRSSGIH
jgi:hypothetical protein